MRLIIGKILVLAVVIGVGSGIAYVTFKRMPADGRAITSTQLAKAVELAEASSAAPSADHTDSVPPTPNDSDAQSPFALSEPSDEEPLPALDEQSAAIPAAESRTAFLFELPEAAATVTPVSFTTESADEPQDEETQPQEPAAASSTNRPKPAAADTSTDEASVMFFGAGPTADTAAGGNPAAATPAASTGRSSGGFTLLPSSDPDPARKTASPTAANTPPANPRRSNPPPTSASRLARENAKAAVGKPATTKTSVASTDTSKKTTKTVPAPAPAPDATAAAAEKPVVSAAPEPANTGAVVAAPIPRTRQQPQPRMPAGPAGNLFFSANTNPSPAATATPTPAPALAAAPPQPAVTAVKQDPPKPPAPKDPLVAQATKSSKPASFPATASLDENPPDTPVEFPLEEPALPALDEPSMDDTGSPTASTAAQPDDLPFMRSLDSPAPAAPTKPENTAAEKTFNPFEPVESLSAGEPPAVAKPSPARPAETPEPAFEPSAEPVAEPRLNLPVAETPQTNPADSSTPAPLFSELTVPEPVPSFPADQPTAVPATKPPERMVPAPANAPTPAPAALNAPASNPAISTPPATPGPFASDAARTRVTPSPQPAPANPAPARTNLAAPREPATSADSNPFAPAPSPSPRTPASTNPAPTSSAELPFESATPAAPRPDESPVRRTQPEPSDLAEVPLPAEPRPFPADPTSPPVTNRRSVEDLQPLPERTPVPGGAGSRTVIQPDRERSSAEPFRIERGGNPERIRSNPAVTPPAADEPEPFPMTEEPGNVAQPAESQPLPPFEEVPSRIGGGATPPPPIGGPSSPLGRTPSEAPIKAVEKLRPQLTIEKKAPESATIGIAHEYRIIVSNDGETAARDVVVEDELNGAADFISSTPPADYDQASGVILWNFDELEPRESREIVVRIRPTGEGMLAGTATVRFRTEVRSATLIRAPRLQLEIDGPDQVLVGEDVKLRFTIRNAGSGDAAGVLLRSVLPDAIRHPEGADLEYGIELLRAGDEQTVDLTAVAAEPGRPVRISAEISAAGIAPVIARNNLTVIGSQLAIERLGPAKRFVGRPAKFQNVVINQTDFEAVDAVITEDVPEGMRVLAVGSGGEYNPKIRRITWQVPSLRAGEQTVLEVELQPESTGRMESIVEVVEKAGFRSRAEENTVVEVEGLHNVTADISRQDQPVAVRERFGFTVAVDNRGTAVARNVELTIEVPAGLQVLAAGTRDIPGRLVRGNIVRYSVVRTLKPGEQLPFKVTLQGREAVRNAVIQAQLKYDEMTQPLIISESVTVFDDQQP